MFFKDRVPSWGVKRAIKMIKPLLSIDQKHELEVQVKKASEN